MICILSGKSNFEKQGTLRLPDLAEKTNEFTDQIGQNRPQHCEQTNDTDGTARNLGNGEHLSAGLMARTKSSFNPPAIAALAGRAEV
jgi:hypothetical protein